MDILKTRVERMMNWQQRTFVLVGSLFVLGFFWEFLRFTNSEKIALLSDTWNSQGSAPNFPAIHMAIGFCGLMMSGAAIVCYLISLFQLFSTGKQAFSVWAGFCYASLAVILTAIFCNWIFYIRFLGVVLALFPGLLIAEMVRLDIKRLIWNDSNPPRLWNDLKHPPIDWQL